MGNDLEKIKKETMLQTSKNWAKQIEAFANASEISFTDYQKEIVINTVRKIYENGFDIMEYDRNNVAGVLYQTAFLNLNPSAIPRHCYFIERNVYENGKLAGKKLEMGIEGEGNDEILRTFGVGVKRDINGQAVGVHKVWVVRDGDEYQEGYYNGLSYQPPTWKPRLLKLGEKKGKILKVVYPIEKTDGSVDFWSADREDLQPIILKHIEQNLMSYKKADKDGYTRLMSEIKNMTFDEIIEKHNDTEITFKYYGKDNTSKVIQDSYTGVTGEAMILRKLRNIAVRIYPKNFNTPKIEKIYESTFEERYDRPRIEDVVVDKLETEVEEKAGQIEILEREQPKKTVQQKEVIVETKIDRVEVTPEVIVETVTEEKEIKPIIDIDKDLEGLFD